jgi:hypothetical protein
MSLVKDGAPSSDVCMDFARVLLCQTYDGPSWTKFHCHFHPIQNPLKLLLKPICQSFNGHLSSTCPPAFSVSRHRQQPRSIQWKWKWERQKWGVEKLLLKLSGLPLKLSLTKVVSGRDTSGYATRSFNAALLPPYPFHPRPFHHSL